MTDIAAPIEAPINPIAGDEATTAGGSAPALANIPDEKGQTLRESIQAAMKDSEPKKDEPKPEKVAPVEEKKELPPEPEVDQDGDAAQEATDKVPSEGRQRAEPPAQFKEQKAKDLWYRAPNEVKAEVARILRENDETTAPLREVSERYEKLRSFDEGVRQSGGDLSQTLNQINDVGKSLKANPIMGLQQTLNMFGPRHPDGRPLSIQEVAHHIVNMGQDGFGRAMQEGQQQLTQQQQMQQFQQTQARMQQLEQEVITAKAASIIEPFRQANPRYDELQDDIAFILQSGRIDSSLSPQERLSRAYEVALRMNPDPDDNAHDPIASASEAAPRSNGGKSIKSSAGAVAVNDSDTEADKGESIRESLRKAMRGTSR